MHLLQTGSVGLDDMVEPVDLGQTPGEIVVLSFADSDLAGLAAAYAAEKDRLPSLRLAHLRDLRHPMSIDLWIDTVGRHAKVIVVRLLGGLDWWRYGVEALSEMARERTIALAVLARRGSHRPAPRSGFDLGARRACRACSRSSARAGARICGRCCAASPATPGANSMRRSRKPCRARRAICRARAR